MRSGGFPGFDDAKREYVHGLIADSARKYAPRTVAYIAAGCLALGGIVGGVVGYSFAPRANSSYSEPSAEFPRAGSGSLDNVISNGK